MRSNLGREKGKIHRRIFFVGKVGKELSASADALCCYCSSAFGVLLLGVLVHS